MDTQGDIKVRQIREAARELFLSRGFSQVSTADLARAAGVSKETLYSRYPTKEALLADVLENLITARPDPSPPPPRLRTRDDLERALTGFVTQLADRLMQRQYLELARIVITETPRLPHLGRVFREAVPERALQRAAGLLRAAHEAGLTAPIDYAAGARMLVGPLVVQVLMHGLLVAPGDDLQKASLDPNGHVSLFLGALPPPETSPEPREVAP